MVGLDTRFVTPQDHRIFFLRLPFDIGIGFLQPFADRFGILVVGMAARFLGVRPNLDVLVYGNKEGLVRRP
jgi:hypothetical protein